MNTILYYKLIIRIAKHQPKVYNISCCISYCSFSIELAIGQMFDSIGSKYDQMCLIPFKSKYRRKWLLLLLGAVVFVGCFAVADSKCSSEEDCSGHGICLNDTCVCNDGWQGVQCQYCGGKVRLGTSNGTIYDGFGNYSLGTKCSWLIDAPNSTITIHLQEFATECGWDHLYIFDGDSVNSPLLAVFSGLMYKDSYKIRQVPEVVAQSGAALVHFFSDDAFNMSGFNITYRINACPSNVSGVDCSGNGVCIDGVCTCDGHWTGTACHLEKCPGNCGRSEGRGTCTEHGCKCKGGFKGKDCSQVTVNGYWESVQPNGFIPPGSASHGAVVWKDSLYVISGESYNKGSMLYTYDFNGHVWETAHLTHGPQMRYAHSTVLYGDKLFIYGGIVGNRGPTSELWAFDINAKSWENITVRPVSCNGSYLLCGPLRVAGHTATLVTNVKNSMADRMIVIFGHSPLLGYLNIVQEYYFRTGEWHIVKPSGFPVKGGYGHTAAWDKYTGKIYVYGGSTSKQTLSTNLYSYDPHSQIWTLLADAPSARFLHSATFVNPALMLVFGGNMHNGTSNNGGTKCYSSEMMAYDAICDTWHSIAAPDQIQSDLARYGHSASVFKGSLYIYGGFDGQMLSDIIRYRSGGCEHLVNQQACLGTRPGVKCVWDQKNAKCINVKTIRRQLLNKNSDVSKCPDTRLRMDTLFKSLEDCGLFEDCTSCVQNTRDCVWCPSGCSYKYCNDGNSSAVLSLDKCPADPRIYCKELNTCNACHSHGIPNYTCNWSRYLLQCKPSIAHNPNKLILNQVHTSTYCPRVCAEFTSCQSCTEDECIWCQNEGRCVDKNAYTSSFPYGQCRDWTTESSKCRSRGSEEESQCSFYSTCAQCRDDPACGWCDDGSRTGLGKCMPGGYAGPTLHTQSLPSSTCPSERWHFTTCPVCQCNGHASCKGNSSMCLPCKDLTDGAHCDRCMPGYWGSPVNGGKCQPCECNGQATQCHPETGKCYCTTKGVVGDHCQNCDKYNHYFGDPINNGLCYYEVTMNYQFTFNLSKKADLQYKQINFRVSPDQPNLDTDFYIKCSVPALMNLTMKTANTKEESSIFTGQSCSNEPFRAKFAKSQYKFGYLNVVPFTTFQVYLYDIQPPLLIQVAFIQNPQKLR